MAGDNISCNNTCKREIRKKCTWKAFRSPVTVFLVEGDQRRFLECSERSLVSIQFSPWKSCWGHLFRGKRFRTVSNLLHKSLQFRFERILDWKEDQPMFLGLFLMHRGKRGKMNPVDEVAPRGWLKSFCRDPVTNGGDKWHRLAKNWCSHKLVGRGIIHKYFGKKEVVEARFRKGFVTKNDSTSVQNLYLGW